MAKGEDQNEKWIAKTWRTRLLLRLLWCVLTAVLSTLAILYQVGKSVPDSLQAGKGKILSLGLRACIGAAQGFLGSLVVPHVAGKVTRQKHVFILDVSNRAIRITNC